MNLLEAVTYLRTNILDDIGGLGSDWESFLDTDSSSLQLRWTNEELASNINEAVNQAYRRILPVKEMNEVFDITTEANTATYTVNPKILQIEGVRSQETGKTLIRIDIESVWDERDIFTRSNTPTCYIPNLDTGKIVFYPKPVKEVTYSLLVYRLPLKTLVWDENTVDSCDNIELREEFIVPMLNYAAALCYEKDEANTLDPNRVSFFIAKFNQEFPQTSAYSDNRKRKTSNRSVKYGGY